METHENPSAIERTELEQTEKRPAQSEGTRPGRLFEPDVDIVENPGAYLVVAELPGVDREHVRVSLEDQVLSIEADLASAPDPSWQPLYQEFRQGGYQRQFRLSDRIDAGAIRASMRDGVLQLELPKVERARPRTIEIQGG